MHKIFYIHKFVVNPDNWVISFFVTAAGVALALALQELVNWLHRKQNTSKFAKFLIEETKENLHITQSIIKACDEANQRFEKATTPLGLFSVVAILEISLRLKKDAYDALKQSEHYLSLSPELSLKISKAYSRLADISSFISALLAIWKTGEEEGLKGGVSQATIDHQKRIQIITILNGTKSITIEAETSLNNLLIPLDKITYF